MRFKLAALTCLLSVAAFAADVTGKYTGEMQGRNGAQPVTMDLKADGSTLTGSVGGPRGSTDIQDGKVMGDTITFSVTREMQGNSIKINYTGTVSGDTIKMKMVPEPAPDRAVEFTVKKAGS